MTTWMRRLLRAAEARAAILLGLGTALLFLLIVLTPPVVPLAVLVLPMFGASLFLSPRSLPWFMGYVIVLLIASVVLQDDSPTREAAAVVVVVLVGLVILGASQRRARLGVAGSQGESMLVDLRDRILHQGEIPPLPGGWVVESALRSAGGTPFAGDFYVASRPSPDRLELAVVDVSGKGEQAGTRALMLSGAFGGLLGALSPAEFLPAANDYLLRQEWDESFATAAHLSVDLVTGRFELRTAGHPPALYRAAGSGRWQILPTEGPGLGMVPDATYESACGTLGVGDGLVLYTDGMVERRRVDIDLGIDRLTGFAEQLMRGGFEGVASRLVDVVGTRDDDRTLLVVARAPEQR